VESDRAGTVVATIVLLEHGAELTVGRIVAVRVDLALLGVLARLQLQALRIGCTIRLRAPVPALCELLGLAGLSELIEDAS
jgi:hypothetical protein